MVSHAAAQSVLWFDYGDQSRFFARMKRTLALSFGAHLLVLLAVMGLRLPHHGERPLTSVEVSLVSMPTPPVAKPTESPKPADPPKRMEPAKVSESKPAPPVKTESPAPTPVMTPSAGPARMEPVPLPEPKLAPLPESKPAKLPASKLAPLLEAKLAPLLEAKPAKLPDYKLAPLLEAKPAPTVKAEAPAPTPVMIPAAGSVKRDILRDLELPPNAPQIGELSPAKSAGKPQQTAKVKVPDLLPVPDLPPVPDLMPEPVKKTPPRAALTENLDRELDEELKKIKQYQPAAKLEIPNETPIKPAPQQEAAAPVVKAPQTTLRTSGSSGTNPFWARVEAIIRNQWEPPPIDVSGTSYNVIIRFRFFRNGTVKDVGIQQASGNSYFDDAGRRAILKPRQFPPFPADMMEPYQDVEMVFRVGEVAG